MEPQQSINQPASRFESLKKVTPLSKYLAMLLFIIMPFVGGWIGYRYAPEKVVEVERIVEVEKMVASDNKTLLVDTLNITLTVPSQWTLESVSENRPGHETHKIIDESGKSVISISHANDLNSYSMIAPMENRTSLNEALKYELISITETQVGNLIGYSGYFLNENIDYVSKQVWVDKEGEIFVFEFDPVNQKQVFEILKNVNW